MNSIKQLLIVIFLFLLTACGGETASTPSRGQAVSPPPASVLSEQVATGTAASTGLVQAVPSTVVVENEGVEEAETAVSASSTQAIPPTAIPPTLTAKTEPTVALVQSGRTEDGGYFLGNPDAPITFIDYSDFL